VSLKTGRGACFDYLDCKEKEGPGRERPEGFEMKGKNKYSDQIY
jgi:hypothetical protein